MPLKVYKNDLSPPSRAVMMVCQALGLPVDLIDVNLFNKEHLSSTYLKMNPVHTVPTLEDTNQNLILHDSHAILIYLVEAYGKSDTLYPKDMKKRALINQKLFFNNSVLFNRLRNITRPALVEGIRTPNEKYLKDIEEGYGFLEAFLSGSNFVAGDQLSIADIAAVTTVTGLAAIVNLDAVKYPKTSAWIQELRKQDFYACSVPGETAYVKMLKENIDL